MQVTGTVIVKKNNKSLRSKDASMKLGGKKRTPQYADHGLVGYSEEPIAAEIDCTFIHTSQTDLADIGDTTNATVTFVTDTGVTYTIREAFCEEPPELSSGGGEVKAKFIGQPAVK